FYFSSSASLFIFQGPSLPPSQPLYIIKSSPLCQVPSLLSVASAATFINISFLCFYFNTCKRPYKIIFRNYMCYTYLCFKILLITTICNYYSHNFLHSISDTFSYSLFKFCYIIIRVGAEKIPTPTLFLLFFPPSI
ncbi:MAG: hypothetical protein PWP18_467, partial [Thermoanaerobacter sp.]|nr:hypothetical protein [Thermoanaerobacter sp.]